MSHLPTGTLTMLFTDIEGSTAILSRLGAEYGDLVSTHRRCLREAFLRWEGVELGTEGDSFFVVFRSVAGALSAARDAQVALARTEWPSGVAVRVRMGLHTGEPTRHEDGYVGMDVHRAARVASSAHGGQVVATEATYRIAVGHRVPGIAFVDLGVHRLKDLGEPQRLYQVVTEGLPTQFPRLRTLGSSSTLPIPPTSLIGRDRDVDAVRGLLDRGSRLTTLTGPGGTGKTRLALAVASRSDERYPEGVYYVPLADVTSTEVVWTTIAEALGLTGDDRGPAALLEHLRPRAPLLVLDNLEQLAGAAGVVTRILAHAPGVQVLATSRRPLHVDGEREYSVEPLSVPSPGDPVPDGAGTGGATSDASEDGAVELFVDRVRLVKPGFTLVADDVEHVREICRSLDGLPLAIELVAARAKLLGPRALRTRLHHSLELSRAAVDTPERQRTLRSTLDWSLQLLPEDARAAFRRLGAFDGDFDLDAVTAVVDPGSDPLDLISELVDASLLTVREGPDGEPRLRLLRTVSLYAKELLEADPHRSVVRRRHAEHYLSVAEGAAAQLRGQHHIRARDTLQREGSNLRAALSWSLAPRGGQADDDAIALGLRLCETLGWYWYGSGYVAEGRRWLEAAVDAAGEVPTRQSMTALHGLGVLLLEQGQAERALDVLRMCVDFWRGTEDLPALATELNSLGLAHRAVGDADMARTLLEAALDTARTAGDKAREANAVSNLAVLALDAERADEAVELLRRSLDLDVELGDAWGQGADHVNLAYALLRSGRVDDGHRILVEHAPSTVELGDVDLTAHLLELFSVACALRGDGERSARLLGSAARLREDAELPMSAQDRAWMDGVLDAVRDRPDPEAWRRNVARGRDLTVSEALRVAVAVAP